MFTATYKILVLVIGTTMFCSIWCNAEKHERESTGRCPSERSDKPVLLPHEKDCGKFYICDAGVPHLKSCQPGLHFNPVLHACDYPKNAGCDSGVSKKGRDGGNGLDILCPLDKNGNPMLRPHETDCRKYYTCSNGITLTHVCQHGLHFNAERQACDYPEKAGCEKGVNKRGRDGRNDLDVLCPLNEDGNPILSPHETDCRKFYTCSNGITLVQVCQHGLHFNVYRQACDYPENAGCDKGINKKGRDGRNDLDFLCPLNEDGNPILRPHETDCRKFYTCSNGITLVQVCQHGLHFNANRQACDYPENAGCEKGVYKREPKGKVVQDDVSAVCSGVTKEKAVMVPHPTDCSKFYICESEASHQKSCPAGLHFSTALQACDYPSNVQCDKMGVLRSVGQPSPFCPEVSGKIAVFYRHPTNCSVYYLCSNGLAYEFVCPARLHFNLRQKKCDYEDKAMCPIGSFEEKNDLKEI